MQFYTNKTIIEDFKNYIHYLLTHKNQYTGLTMAEDPTVAIIETGNELSGPDFGDKYVPNSWTQEIASFVKSLGPHKLIMDGTYGINKTHFALDIIDIFSDHFYPLNDTQLKQDIAAVKTTNRAYVAGEYDWTGLNGGDSLKDFFSIIEAEQTKAKPGVSGDLFWRYAVNVASYVSADDLVSSCTTCHTATNTSTTPTASPCTMAIQSIRPITQRRSSRFDNTSSSSRARASGLRSRQCLAQVSETVVYIYISPSTHRIYIP